MRISNPSESTVQLETWFCAEFIQSLQLHIPSFQVLSPGFDIFMIPLPDVVAFNQLISRYFDFCYKN